MSSYQSKLTCIVYNQNGKSVATTPGDIEQIIGRTCTCQSFKFHLIICIGKA